MMHPRVLQDAWLALRKLAHDDEASELLDKAYQDAENVEQSKRHERGLNAEYKLSARLSAQGRVLSAFMFAWDMEIETALDAVRMPQHQLYAAALRQLLASHGICCPDSIRAGGMFNWDRDVAY